MQNASSQTRCRGRSLSCPASDPMRNRPPGIVASGGPELPASEGRVPDDGIRTQSKKAALFDRRNLNRKSGKSQSNKSQPGNLDRLRIRALELPVGALFPGCRFPEKAG